tara:strand:- start:185 stop:334 length:150 start_codon:yes stop_codon:yes gene_type:complete
MNNSLNNPNKVKAKQEALNKYKEAFLINKKASSFKITPPIWTDSRYANR